MYSFSGSQDSRYFVVRKESDLSLLRFENELWRRKLPYPIDEILGVGNNGNITLRCDEGILLFKLSEQEPADLLKPFSKAELAPHSSCIGKTTIKDIGTQICLEKITIKPILAGKILGAFKIGDNPAIDQELHEIIFYSIPERKYDTYYKFVQSKNHENKFTWSISRNFGFMVIGEPRRRGSGIRVNFKIVHVDSFEEYHQFHLTHPDINGIMINNHGSVVIDLNVDRERDLLIVTSDGKIYHLTPPPDSRVIHLGKNYVALLTYPSPVLLIKSYENTLLCLADLKSLEELVIPFHLSFNSKDEIDIIYVLDDEVKIQNSGIDRIQIDAKRWELLARHVREGASAAHDEPQKGESSIIYFDEAAGREEHESFVQTEDYPIEKGGASKLLDALRLQYITGQISEEEYMKVKDKLEGDFETSESSDFETAHPSDPAALPKDLSIAQSAQSKAEAPMQGSYIATKQLTARKKAAEQVEEADGVAKREPGITEASPDVGLEKAGPCDETKAPADAIDSEGKPSTGKSSWQAQREKDRIQKLLQALEERFMVGEVSEETYKTLREKYSRMLGSL